VLRKQLTTQGTIMTTYNITDAGLVTLTCMEFHDILTTLGCLNNMDGDSIGVSAIALVRDPNLSNTDFESMQDLAVKLVSLMQQIQEADSAFHDICEMYC
jgi:hypothetical protein